MIKIYLDGCCEEAIRIAEKFDLGLTTNPTIMHKDYPEKGILWILERLTQTSISEIFVQMDSFEEKIVEKLNPKKFVIKIPWLREKYDLALEFKRRGFRICATSVYYPSQILTALMIGTDYIAFYFDRSLKKGLDPKKLILTFKNILEKSNSSSILLVASLKSVDQVFETLRCGITHLSLPLEVFYELLKDNEFTVEDAKHFFEDFSVLINME